MNNGTKHKWREREGSFQNGHLNMAVDTVIVGHVFFNILVSTVFDGNSLAE